jgi:hypothetical protein
MNDSTMHRHLDDGALARLLDGEPDATEHAAHVADCAACDHRLRVLSARGSAFSELLGRSGAATAAPPADLWDRAVATAARRSAPAVQASEAIPIGTAPSRRGMRRPGSQSLARAAAVAGLLLAGSLAAEPTRRWLGERLAAIAEALGGGGEEAPALPPPAPVIEPAPEATPGSTVVGFVPAVDRLVIRIDRPQARGSVQLVFEDRADATGEVLGAGPGVSLTVLPTGFRAGNEPGDTASYRFRIPVGLAVVVQVGDRIAAEMDPDGATEVAVPLGGG